MKQRTALFGKRSLKTFQYIMRLRLEEAPKSYLESELGVGKAVHIAIPLTMRARDLSGFLWLYAESRLPDKPMDPSIGFTEDDVRESTGIYFYRKVGLRFCGEMLPLEALLLEIPDLSLRNRIIFQIEEMKTSIRLEEDFIEHANIDHGKTIISYH